MKDILQKLLRNKILRTRLIILFLVLIYLPILLNIYIIYSRTLNVVKEEKIEASKEVLKKTIETLEYNIKDISGNISNFSNSLSIGASIAKYYTIPERHQVKIDAYLQEKVEEVVESNYYIDDAFFITKEDQRLFSVKKHLNVDKDKLLTSSVYENITSDNRNEIWLELPIETFMDTNVEEKALFVVHKVYHIVPQSKDQTSNISQVDEEKRVVAYIFAYINKEKIMDLYEQTNFINQNKIIIYDQGHNPFITKPSVEVPVHLIKAYKEMGKDIITEEIDIADTSYALTIGQINPVNWSIAKAIPIQSLIGATKSGLKRSLWLIGLISIIVSLIIIIEIFILSREMTEKEMVHYRLSLSESMNEKLRMYKHDFTNHLQIVQGLLEMKYPERAVSYLRNVVKEGRLIHKNYEIGIPELEATISTVIHEARLEGIEVMIDTIELTEQLPINLYDLMKIMTNLVKNAMYALTHAQEAHKVLSIKIGYELGEYIFEISNNTPLISEKYQNKIFEKGFTTKGQKGNGLGLHIVKRLVNKNHGEIELVVNEKGNHFIVRFPDEIE